MRYIISRSSYTRCYVVKLFHAREMLGSTREREITLSVLTAIHYLTSSLNMIGNPNFLHCSFLHILRNSPLFVVQFVITVTKPVKFATICISSSSSSHICHAAGPLVDPFRSHVSRSLFKDLP